MPADTERLFAVANRLLRWGHANGGMLSPTFIALRDDLPDVAIEFAVRPEQFPEATLQEVVYGLDPAAVAIAVEGTITADTAKHKALVLSVLSGSDAGGAQASASQSIHAWEVVTSALGVPGLGAKLPVQGSTANLLPLAQVPRGDLAEVRDPAEHFVHPADEEIDLAGRKRTSLDVGAINRWAQAPEPARRVAVLGTASQLELLQSNGLLPPVSIVEVPEQR